MANKKLTTSDVIRIKRLINEGRRNCDLAAQYQVDVSSISNIRHKKTWRHVK
jgi:hypothetical protein